ncbi:MAG: PSD1 and planctomycete cytochrome C domain-containing protein, partial [Planctomycetia bacterium]
MKQVIGHGPAVAGLPRGVRAVVLLAAVSAVCLATTSGAAEVEVRFDRDIRPLLSENCFACHGPDAKNRAANLRLDTFEGATSDLGDHAAIVPGAGGRSVILERITSSDPDLRMPPPETGKSLTEQQITVVRRWIDAGAAYSGHWAYEPLIRPELPSRASEKPESPIDAFVDHELARKGIVPVEEADRATLIRRLFLDLTGLPPEPADVDAFMADRSEDAWRRLVDRVLVSPHHAERMAQWWLDLARYADTVGFHGDQPMNVWPYRDWVIRAFRENMPFDDFSRAQLAGDLLPEATRDQKLAAVYNRLALMSAEGGGQTKEYLAKYAADRVRAVGGAWLGSTIGCAECHDHKYDPFTSRDFYSLAAFFADIKEQGIYPFDPAAAAKGAIWGEMERFFSPQESARLADLDHRLAEARQAHDADTPELTRSREEWLESLESLPRFETLRPLSMASARGAMLVAADEQSVIVQGPRPDADDVTLVFDLPPGPLGAIRLETLADKRLPAGGPGRAGNGNYVVTEVTAALRPAAATDQPEPRADDMPIRLVHAAADFEQAVAGDYTPSGKWLAAYTIDGDASGATVGWAVHEQVGRSHWLVVRPAEPVVVPAGMRLVVSIAQHHGKGYTLGRFRVGISATLVDESGPGDLPPTVRQAIGKPEAARTPDERAAIATHHRSIAAAWKERREELSAAEKARATFLDGVPLVPVTVSGPRRTVRVLPRGNWMDESGAVVDPAPPTFLTPPFPAGGSRSRVELADWLFAKENPLVARVLANRLWAVCFGQGLSRRLDDHGSQGEPPSHPELVDWLACELRDGGVRGSWDIRHLLQTIVMSRAYRRSSTAPRA